MNFGNSGLFKDIDWSIYSYISDNNNILKSSIRLI